MAVEPASGAPRRRKGDRALKPKEKDAHRAQEAGQAALWGPLLVQGGWWLLAALLLAGACIMAFAWHQAGHIMEAMARRGLEVQVGPYCTHAPVRRMFACFVFSAAQFFFNCHAVNSRSTAAKQSSAHIPVTRVLCLV